MILLRVTCASVATGVSLSFKAGLQILSQASTTQATSATSAANRPDYLNAYNAGSTQTDSRARALQSIADTQSLIDGTYNESFVVMEYFGYLRRDPEEGGFDFWLGKVNERPLRDIDIQHAMACSFITSAEYQTRFSPVVTHTNGECPQ